MKKANVRTFIYFLATLILVASNYLLASAADFVWTNKASMPTSRSHLAAVVLNNKIYAIAGNSGGTRKEVEMYDPATDSWSTKDDLLNDRYYLSATVANNKIYAFGGLNGMIETVEEIEEYDPNTNSWSVVYTFPGGSVTAGGYGIFTGTVNNKIYIIGGGAFGVYYNNVYEFDPVAYTLTKKNGVIPTPRYFGATIVLNNKIYCIGGVHDSGTLNTLEVYDPVTDSWSSKNGMNTPRMYCSGVAINNKIYVFGGNGWINALDSVEEYDVATDSWTTLTPMSLLRDGVAAVAVNDKVYVIGGTDNTQIPFASIEEGTLNPLISWTGELNYTSSGVSPTTGTLSTNFAYRVKYTHDGNIAPKSGYPKVHIKKGGVEISNSPFVMIADNAADTTYTDGKLYYYNISGLILGSDYTYYFEGLDANDQTPVGAAIQSSTGPAVNNSAPILGWTEASGYVSDGADPDTGRPDTNIVLQVKYTDNGAPKSSYPKVYIKKDGTNISGSPFIMVEADSNDTIYNDGKIYSYSTILTAGTGYTYYFEAFDEHDAVATGTPTQSQNLGAITNSAPTLEWTGETNYESDGVNPEQAPPSELFIYRVKYNDTENDSPKSGYPKVHIKKGGVEITDSPITMTETDSTDTTYSDGKLYTYSTTLTDGNNLTYYFEAYDKYEAAATGTPITEIDAPDVQNNAPVLTLIDGGISPSTPVGPATLFIYTVEYKDADNNPPKNGYPKLHIKKNGADITGSPFTMFKISGNFNTGAVYRYQISNLTSGMNTFEFEAYDCWNAPALLVGGNGPVIPSISGRTLKSDGSYFGNVNIRLFSRGSAPPINISSDNQGYYEFPNLNPGSYSLTASRNNYSSTPLIIDNLNTNLTGVNITLIIRGNRRNTMVVAGNNGKVNPVKNEKAKIRFLPTDSGTVTVKIYNIAGELIWDFSKEVTSDIQDNIEWNGKNNDGNIVASGIYLVYIQGCGLRAIEKLAVIK